MTKSLSILLKTLKWTAIAFLSLLAFITVLISLIGLYSYFSQPPITRDLFDKSVTAEQVFIERISQAYPNGMLERQLRADLEKQGFLVKADSPGASYRQNGFPCSTEWFVNWKVDEDGRAQEIKGTYWPTCL